MPGPRLTETSFIVLGLLEHLQPATPYDLKRAAEQSTFNFWRVPHTQLYTECARLAQAGLIDEQREPGGRRRRVYRLEREGRRALERWRSEPTVEGFVLRDAATLKLFFGAAPRMLAETQLQVHREQLRNYEKMREELAEGPEGWRLALEYGIGHERESVRFWSRVLAGEEGGS